MSNHSVIEHRANYHYVKIEEDYITICSQGEQSPYCKALILAILEHWTNAKRDKGEDTAIYMTYPLWVESMYGMFRRNIIILSLQELEKEKMIERKKFITSTGKDSFTYILCIDIVQEKLKQLPEKKPENTRPNLNAFKNKRVRKQTGLEMDGKSPPAVDFQTADEFKTKPNIDTTTQLPNNIDSDSIAQSTNVSAQTPSPFSFSSEEEMIAYLQEKGLSVVSQQETEESVPPATSTQPSLEETSSSETHALFEEVKPAKPQMPPADMPFTAKKLVLITECLRYCDNKQGEYFSTTPTGKKGQSQWDRQLIAAKKIFAEIPALTEKDYILAYSDRNDDWWNRSRGSLTVEAMAANTERKGMRIVELLEKVRSRSEHIKPALQLVTTQQNKTEAPQPSKKLLTPDELKSMPMVGW